MLVPQVLPELSIWVLTVSGTGDHSFLRDLWSAELRFIEYSDNLDNVLRILAMVIAGWKLKSKVNLLLKSLLRISLLLTWKQLRNLC